MANARAKALGDVPLHDPAVCAGQGATCLEDTNNISALMRQLKVSWGKEYTSKYKLLKANKAQWRTQVDASTMINGCVHRKFARNAL